MTKIIFLIDFTTPILIKNTDKIRRKKEDNYRYKINWLWNKQQERRKLPQTNVTYNQNTIKARRNKKDRYRYTSRKIYKEKCDKLDALNKVVLNKSKFELTEEEMELLCHGLNFAPTPRWNDHTENIELFNLHQHIRRIEWHSILGKNDDTTQYPKMSDKLKIPKFSSPAKEEVCTRRNHRLR